MCGGGSGQQVVLQHVMGAGGVLGGVGRLGQRHALAPPVGPIAAVDDGAARRARELYLAFTEAT